MSQSKLLDPNIANYEFKPDKSGWYITDEKGIQLGKIIGFRSPSICDNDGSLIVKTHRKFFSGDWEIKDSNDNLIGKIKEKNNLITLKNQQGEELLLGERPLAYNVPIGINNSEGEEIAFVEKKEKSKIARWFHEGDISLHIEDLLFDRKTMLGFWFILNYYGNLEDKSEWQLS